MRKTYVLSLIVAVLIISACGSDRNSENRSDSMMTDSAVMDEPTSSTDTTTMGTGQTGPDSTVLNP